VTLVDTAGLREARDAIEAEGVRRARAAQQVAALNLLVIDGSETTPGVVSALSDNSGSQNRLIVATKSDLPAAWSASDLGLTKDTEVIRVSSLTGAGLDELRARIATALTDRDDLRDPPAITNARHLSLVEDAHAAITRAETALQDGATEELVLTDITAARRALEEITGRRTTDDLLTHIFARFCLGK
jgi:tRNA modification GTPase